MQLSSLTCYIEYNRDLFLYLVTIFFLNTFVYKHLEAKGRSFSIKSRIVVGMISAAFAMCMAGTVEIFRQRACDELPTISQIIGIC